MPAHKIVLTGGPCSGKSTALPAIASSLRNKDYQVYTVPEMATMFFQNGVKLKMDPPDYAKQLEKAAFKVQLEMEMGFERLAHLLDPRQEVVILCDRGLIDLAAYCPPQMWTEIVRECHWSPFTTPELLLNIHYDLVLHLRSTAVGAEQHFTNDNNPARQCTPEVARHLDGKTYDVWTGHKNRIVIDNSTDMNGKIDRAIQAIDSYFAQRKK